MAVVMSLMYFFISLLFFISFTDNNMDVPCESARANFKTKLKNDDRNYKREFPSSLEATINDELITKSINKPQTFVGNVTGCCYGQTTLATTASLVITIC